MELKTVINLFRKIKHLFSNTFWCANLDVLQLCHEAYNRFICDKVVIIIISIIVTISAREYVQEWNILLGIASLFVYNVFLSNMNMVATGVVYKKIKFIISTAIAIYIAFFVGKNWFQLEMPWKVFTIEHLVVWCLIVTFCLVLCYYPVKFISLQDSLYGKLMEEERQYNAQIANIEFSIRANNAIAEAKSKAEIMKEADEEFANAMSKEITQARIRLAKIALQKWEEKQRSEIEKNFNKYIEG